jgi:hypothetical protein
MIDLELGHPVGAMNYKVEQKRSSGPPGSYLNTPDIQYIIQYDQWGDLTSACHILYSPTEGTSY